MAVRNQQSQNPHLIYLHQVLEKPQDEFAVPVALVRIDVLAHAIYTVAFAFVSRPEVADHRRHHLLELE